LDCLRFDRVHLFGHSQGGYLAQCLPRARPQRIASVTLSATCLPHEKHARRIERQLRLLPLVPGLALRIAAAARIRRIAAPDVATLTPNERRFWLNYLIAGLGVPDLRPRAEATARLQFDYHRRAVFGREDLAAWPGRILIIMFGRGALIDAEDAADLMANYPTAEHVDFPDSGHLGLIIQASEIAQLLTRRIDEAP
jgi:pimeloyl-ACP methyl ester carboxylesterase